MSTPETLAIVERLRAIDTERWRRRRLAKAKALRTKYKALPRSEARSCSCGGTCGHCKSLPSAEPSGMCEELCERYFELDRLVAALDRELAMAAETKWMHQALRGSDPKGLDTAVQAARKRLEATITEQGDVLRRMMRHNCPACPTKR